MALAGFVPWDEETAKKYVAKGYWTGKSLGDFIEPSVKAKPDKVAIIAEDGRKVTYAELSLKADRVALKLREMGLKQDDAVLIQLPNWPEFIIAYFGILRAGLVVTLTVPQFRSIEVRHLAKLTDAVAIIVPREFGKFNYPQMVKEIMPDVPKLKHVLVVGDPVPDGSVSLNQVMETPLEKKYPADYLAQFKQKGTDVAQILHTGGTTGLPKGVPRTHNDYILVSTTQARQLGYDKTAVGLISLPIALNASLGRAIGFLANGGTIVLNTTTSAEALAKAIQRDKVTHILMAPTNVVDILSFPEWNKYDISSLRNIMCGVGYLAPELLKGLRDKVPATCKITRGSAWQKGPVSGLASMTHLKWDSIVLAGLAARMMSLKLYSDGNEVPRGEQGELVTRGPHVFRGYYKNPQENALSFTNDGFFRTGDLAVQDKAGDYMITGRIKEWIRRGGMTIVPVEIEEPLLKHPKVENVAIVGMPDPRLGERTCAYIKPKPGKTLTLEEVTSFLAAQGLATYKLPERLELVDIMPVTVHDKVDKKLLRQQIADKLKAEGAK
ncbi:MAG: 2,3-dihydroxybenzoate-AMP ligase [Dehalococcoidia bacterium]|nr:2,3-dihydroxybenzoate-AMP ligase [Dehalococcoidia bacterium]